MSLKQFLQRRINKSLERGAIRSAAFHYKWLKLSDSEYKEREATIARTGKLDEHPSANYFPLEPGEPGVAYEPGNIGQPIITHSVRHPAVTAIELTACHVHARLSAFYDPGINTLFLLRIEHEDERAAFDYTTGPLIFQRHDHAILSFPSQLENIEQGIFLGGNGSHNYYHFFVELLAKANYFNSLPDGWEDAPVLVNELVLNIPNYKALLEHFISNCPVIPLSESKTYEVKKLLYITNPVELPHNLRDGNRYKAEYCLTRPTAISFLRNRGLELIGDTLQQKPIDRLFLSRKQEQNKGIRKYNVEAVTTLLQEFGFEEVFMEEKSIAEQAHLLGNANYVVGPTGSAWTNLLFAKKGAKGLCWMGDIWGSISVYSNLAGCVGFNLYFHRFPVKGNNPHGTYSLDLDKLKGDIENLLSQ